MKHLGFFPLCKNVLCLWRHLFWSVNLIKIWTDTLLCNLISDWTAWFHVSTQVDDSSDTRPFHVDPKGQGGQTTVKLILVMPTSCWAEFYCSEITPALGTLTKRYSHLVYNCWSTCNQDKDERMLWIYERAWLHACVHGVCASVNGSWSDQDILKAPLISWLLLKTLPDCLIVGVGRPWLLDFILIPVAGESYQQLHTRWLPLV